MLGEIVENLREHMPVDALVLPGGYFVEGKANAYLHGSFGERCELLQSASIAGDVLSAVEILDKQRSGALLIVGVDTGKRLKDPEGDQLCVAWSADGPVGIGRKVFPTKEEGRGGFVVNVDDFRAQERVVQVGKSCVLLCSCYDGYGVANSPDKSGYIRKIVAGGNHMVREVGRAGREFRHALKKGLAGWTKLVEGASGAAIAIHRFGGDGKPFSTNYWRRHGIATASAKLGGWAVAGANFDARLPYRDSDMLAADCVPFEHLAKGQRRETWDATPIGDYVVGDGDVLVRVFEFA